MPNEIVFDDSIEIIFKANSTSSHGRPITVRLVGSYGTINDKPFHLVGQKRHSWNFTFRGIGCSFDEREAVKKQARSLDAARSLDNRETTIEELQKLDPVGKLFEGRVLFFDVPDRSKNTVMKQEGGQWSPIGNCWNTILGANVARLTAEGIVQRQEPEPFLINRGDNSMYKELKAAGAFYMSSHGWFLDLAVHSPEVLEPLGLTISDKTIMDVIEEAAHTKGYDEVSEPDAQPRKFPS